MAYSHRLFRQLGKPEGLIGRLVLSRLNRVNRAMNELTHKGLDMRDDDELLEIGFGGGALIADLLADGRYQRMVGIDVSDLAVNRARKRFRKAVTDGRLELVHGGMDGLEFPENSFSKVCSVNVIYFWDDVGLMLAEIHRVLRPGGRLALCYSEGSPDNVTRFPVASVEARLLDAGFQDISTLSGNDRENGLHHCSLAHKP